MNARRISHAARADARAAVRREHERQLAQKLAQFIAEARARGLSNSALLIAIDRTWPRLNARTLIAGHFIDQLALHKGALQ